MESGEQPEILKEISPCSFLSLLGAVLELLRPRQWTKNFFLFAGLVFSGNLFNLQLFLKTLLAFGVFCLLSGAVYIVNDLVDLEADRQHDLKRLRPLVAGRVSRGEALVILGVLLAVSWGFSLIGVGEIFLLVAVLYFLLVTGYSLYFKHIVILDVFAVASGFLLRVVAGGVAVGVRISPWLLICTLLLSLFLALTKRRYALAAGTVPVVGTAGCCRQHDLKRLRPLAAGRVSRGEALVRTSRGDSPRGWARGWAGLFRFQATLKIWAGRLKDGTSCQI